MEYAITFLEGIISFISPCMLPMLPLYLSYFAGGDKDFKSGFWRALAFVLGFTIVFCMLGLFAGGIGALLMAYKSVVHIISGAIVVMLGLSYLEVIRLSFFKGIKGDIKVGGILSAFLFGVVFSVSLTPCVGAFLGSALMMASTSQYAMKGFFLLLSYSMGLGVPFLICALLVKQISGTFDMVKRHYGIINKICGVFLILIGVLMMTGMLDKVLGLFSH